MYAYPLERGVVSSIDKPEYLTYVCWCVGSDSYGKLLFYCIISVSDKRITATLITWHGMALQLQVSQA